MKNTNWYKRIFQYGILAILGYMAIRIFTDKAYNPDFEAYCPFGGLQALATYFTRESLSCSMTSVQILMGVALFAGIIFFGKLFCGYICPLGTVGELLGKVGEKMKIRFTIGGVADKALRSVKYILLFVTFYFTLESSELFCKKFDPYYAISSGFNADVVVLYAVIAILILFVGSVFIRMFWCRFACPLGALSNIFKYSWAFLGILALYLVLVFVGVAIPFYIPIAVMALTAYLLEILAPARVRPSLVHITRNDDSCINCKLCSKKCPQGIDVASLEVVSHVDCTMCGDCLYVCPEKDTLQINKSNKRWLPAVVIVVLVAGGIILSSFWEVPTINVKWGSEEQLDDAETFTISDLKNIKCFGSSTAFANQMRKVEGIYGVATYVGTHSVKLTYDGRKYTEEDLQELIFVPQKKVVAALDSDVETLSVYRLEVDKFFDPLDANYLFYLLRQKTDACGFITEFGCPVKIDIYFPEGKEPSSEELADVIESKKVVYTVRDKEYSADLKYKVISSYLDEQKVGKAEYASSMYTPFRMIFNKYSTYSQDVLKSLDIPMGKNKALRSKYSYLVSHVSNNRGVVAFRTFLDENQEETGRFTYVDSLTAPAEILEMIKVDSLSITFSNGTTKKVYNEFDFD